MGAARFRAAAVKAAPLLCPEFENGIDHIEHGILLAVADHLADISFFDIFAVL
jgi:hypothetical protein